LGILIPDVGPEGASCGGDCVSVYNPTINGVLVYSLAGALEVPLFDLRYESSDCTGTPYMVPFGGEGAPFVGMVFENADEYYRVSAPGAVSRTIVARRLNSGDCVADDTSTVYLVEQVSPPTAFEPLLDFHP